MAKDFDKILDSWGRQTSSRLNSTTPPNSWMTMVRRARFAHQATIFGAIIAFATLVIITVALLWANRPNTEPAPQPTAREVEPDPVRMIDGVPRLRDTDQ